MDNVMLIEAKEFLGREFLTWLWFKSEAQAGHFDIDDQTIELWIGNRVVLADSDDTEQVVCKGENSELEEAKRALSQSKKVCIANYKFYKDDAEYSFTLDSKMFNFKNLKTPKIELNKEDPDGLFFEKVFLMQQVIDIVEKLFAEFMNVRTSNWAQETEAIKDWYNTESEI